MTDVAAVQPLLMEQVVKTMLETTELKDSPFAALLQSTLADEVKSSMGRTCSSGHGSAKADAGIAKYE